MSWLSKNTLNSWFINYYWLLICNLVIQDNHPNFSPYYWPMLIQYLILFSSFLVTGAWPCDLTQPGPHEHGGSTNTRIRETSVPSSTKSIPSRDVWQPASALCEIWGKTFHQILVYDDWGNQCSILHFDILQRNLLNNQELWWP